MRWQRIAGWSVAGLLALIVVLVAAGILFLRTHYFSEYAIHKIVGAVQESTGGRAEIGSFDFKLSTLTAHLYNITIHGTEPPSAAPLLHADKLTVGLKIQSVLQKKITLSELVVDRPSVNLLVDSHGKSNIPHAPPSQSGSNTSIFDLAVGRTQLNQGEITYNDKKTPLDADLHNLNLDVHFDSLATRYAGTLSYDDGHITYASYQPLPHSLQATFNATPKQFSIDSANLRVASSTIALHATMTNYADPVVDGSYEVNVRTQDFAALAAPVEPAGSVALNGKVHYHAAPNQTAPDQSLMQALSVEGQIASEELSAVSPEARMNLKSLRGKYRLANGRLHADDIVAQLLGGEINASLDMDHLDTTPSTVVNAALRNISLRAAQQAIRTPSKPPVMVLGTLDGKATAAWAGPIQNLRAKSDVTIRSAQSVVASSSQIPVNGEIHATYDGPSGSLTLRQTSLRAANTSVNAQGQISKNSSLQLQATATDLHQLIGLASSLGASKSAPLAISGSATADATIRGSLKAPRIAGQLRAQNLQVQGSDWSLAQAAFEANPSQIKIERGSLTSAHQGKASFSATVALSNWSYTQSSPIQANLSVQQMPVTDLQRLANVQYPVSGDLFADLSISGTQLNPSGSGSAHIANARAYDESFQTLAVKFHTDQGTIISSLNLAIPAGSANAELSYNPQNKAYTVRFNAPGVALQELHAVQVKNLPVSGTIMASVEGKGTVDRPELGARIESSQLQLKQNTISGLKADLRVADQRADFSLNTNAAQASIKAQGHMSLEGNYETEASVDTTSIPLDLLLATYTTVPEGFKGQTEFHATVKGPLKDKTQIEAHLTIPQFNASYQSLEIGAASPIRADYAHSVVTLQPAEIKGTGTSLRIQGTVPLAGSSSPTLTANGTVDVRILRIVAPDVQSSGTVALDVRASGTSSNPQVQGQLHLQNIALATESAPLGVENLNGTLNIANDRVQISSLTAQVGGGNISAGGSVAYRPALQFNVALRAHDVRLRYPDGLRTLLDGNLALTGTTQASSLNGKVLIDSLSFTPDFDLAKFGDQFGGNSVPSQPGFADNVRLAIAVQSKDNLSATSSQISIEGGVNLQVTGTAANPVILGRTDLTSGELFYRNLRYQLQHGLITFDNPTQTDPKMDVAVTTTVEQYTLTLTLRGTLDKLETTYTSDPPLATADVINLIARGTTTEEAGASSQSTDSIIASQAASQLSSGVQKLAGISSLQIDPLIGGNNSNPSARIALQQRVTKNFLFTFSTDVSQPGTEVVEGDYQINKRWSVSVARDETGGVSVDGKYHTKF